MTYISYAQNYEDIMLWRALKHIDNGFYIDVGANDPDIHSVTKNFYDNNWHGVNIEPLEKNYKRFLQSRPKDINFNIAISDENTLLDIWESEDELGGLATLDRNIALQHEINGFKGKWNRVEVITLNELISQLKVKDIHFLKIDVEGFEKKVIESNDWSLNRPWIVVVEATKPLSKEETHHEWESIIVGSRYHLVYKDGLNRFYVADEKSYLDIGFEYPPNVFDDFVKIEPYYEDEIKRNKELVESLKKKNIELEFNIESMCQSLSWKITKPFRISKGYFKKISNIIFKII